MTEPRTFTLTQLKHLLAENDDQLVGNYISQHLAIARRIELSAVEQKIASGGSDYMKLMELEQKKQELSAALDEKMERWAYLTDLAEQIEAQKK